jgi:beta-lactamase class A
MAANSSAKRKTKLKSPAKISRQQQLAQGDKSVPLSIKLVRLIICGLGISAIAGTTISVINPPKQPLANKVDSPLPGAKIPQLKLTVASPELDRQLKQAIAKNNKLDSSYLFVEVDSGEYSQLGADRVLPAASTIKLPILIALFQDVDAGKVQLTENLTINKQSIAGGSGDLQTRKPGTKVSILIAATKMMTISDNTATNLLIDRLGGKTALNQRFRQWGLKVTTINQPLPDLAGTNITTASELSRSILAINRGKIVSDISRLQILSMMSRTTRNTMLPKGLGAGAKIAHKTGDIGKLVADVGSIKLPSGKHYIAAVLVKRPHNDPAAPELIRKLSKIVYTHFQQPQPNLSAPNPVSSVGGSGAFARASGRLTPKQ